MERRFNDTQWLKDSLRRDFPGNYIPPMANKGGKNKFDPVFLKKRMFYIQEFLNAICQHPQLRASPHFNAYLTIADSDAFEKAKKEIDKAVTSNSILQSGRVDKKYFLQKNPIKAENIPTVSGSAECKINADMKNYCTSMHTVVKESLPLYAKYYLV